MSYFLDTRPQIPYRKGCSLKNKLVKSHLDPRTRPTNWLTNQIRGYYRCGDCVNCRFIQTGTSFTSNQTGHKFDIQFFLNCKSTRPHVSVAEYIGKTICQFRRWVGEHLGDLRHERDTPLARHIRSCQNGVTTDWKFLDTDRLPPDKVI